MRGAATRLASALVATGLAVAAVGCSEKPSVSTSTAEATVKGKVLINGKPATKGEVMFDPSNYAREKAEARRAPIGPDGTYTITTLVGENSVKVLGPEASKAGGEYSRVTFDVQAGENTFDIPVGSVTDVAK